MFISTSLNIDYSEWEKGKYMENKDGVTCLIIIIQTLVSTHAWTLTTTFTSIKMTVNTVRETQYSCLAGETQQLHVTHNGVVVMEV